MTQEVQGYKGCSTRPDPHSRFERRLILQIVKEVEDGLPRKDACERYGMAYVTLKDWINNFASEEFLASRVNRHSLQQRRSVVRLIQDKKITKQQALELYKKNKRTLSLWLSQAKKEESEIVSSNLNSMPAVQVGPQQLIDEELKQAKLKIKALETMIDIAEQQFKIPIRKKPGAKQ